METVQVVNIKCWGCKKTISSELEKIWATNISIDIESQKVSFQGDRDIVLQKLASIGYPEYRSKQAKSLLKKARSFISCAIGKTK